MLITITGCANNISKNKENQAEISEPDIPVHISKEVIDVEGMEENVIRGGIETINFAYTQDGVITYFTVR